MKLDITVEVEQSERVLPALEPVPLPSHGELAGQARAASAFRLLRMLATGTEGCRVTSRGELTLAEASKAVALLGLPGDRGAGSAPARSAADFGELHELWGWAVAGDVVYLTGQRARPGRRVGVLGAGTDDEVLDLWATLVGVELDQWAAAFALRLDVVAAVVACCRTADACAVTDLVDAATQAEEDGWPLEACAEPPDEVLVEMLTSLGRLGLVVTSQETVRCTDLGLWALRSWLATVGVPTPETVGDSV
jgi:hypothetical protein